jgi:RimJ/RimL family protein N-acetyltransferase
MEEIKFLPFPELTTKRLLLRQLKKTDNLAIFSLRSDENINKYLDRPKTKSIDKAEEFILKINDGIKLNDRLYWAICLKENPALIGTICLWNFSDDKATAEVGYELKPSYQGRGLMNEALARVIKFGFQKIKLNKIEAFTHKENIRSTKLLKKNDFILMPDRIDPENLNIAVYSRTNRK